MVSALVPLLALAGVADAASSLGEVKHVVMMMLDNRSFQHYFGTMAGVRGFADPNVQINPDGRSVWYQNVTGLTDKADWMLPYWFNYKGGEEAWNKSQCLCAGANNWIPTQQALNGGLNNKWAQIDKPQSWGYFKREDLPYHFALADAYTLGDHNFAGITSNTNANRRFWESGSINVPGGKQSPDQGGIILDNNQVNGCTGPGLNCLPIEWPAFAQYLDEAGVDWRAYQNSKDWATTNGLFYFKAFQDADKDSSMYKRGLVFDGDNGLSAFQKSAAEGTLPEVSWIFPPGILQEHPPRSPVDGSWYINQVVNAAIHGKNYNDTIFIINYDEAGGWGDAVMPIVSPEGTAGEWFEDPYGELGYTYSGPGVRVPLLIISPYTRGGHVFTERADHTSALQFLEKYLEARGYEGIVADQISDWRREHMSDLVNAFDFENPDYSIPDLPVPRDPIRGANGDILGLYSGHCSKVYQGHCSSDSYVDGIPFGEQTEEEALFFEDGFKGVRGYLTEGRFLTFESNGYALTNLGVDKQFTTTKATDKHEDLKQRWVLHALEKEGTTFNVASALDGKWISQHSSLSISRSGAQKFSITRMPDGTYALKKENGSHLNIVKGGGLSFDKNPIGFQVFSVTYHD
ncbi:non-hemolytic phospholipase c [Sarocladium strictum]